MSNDESLFMSNNRHPTYPAPAIKEAVCEIRFRLESVWSSTFYSEYFKAIEESFPTFEPVVPAMSVQIEQLPGRVPSLTIPLVMRYKHGSRNILIQLSENRIVVNVLPVYSGWQQFCDDIVYSWGKLCAIVTPLEITRIGLRYINSIACSTADETLSKWLAPTAYVPESVLESGRGFTSYISSVKSEKDRIQVGLADQKTIENGFGAFIFDIDRVTEGMIAADEQSLLENVNRLHDEIWDVFSSAKNERLELLLKGEF